MRTAVFSPQEDALQRPQYVGRRKYYDRGGYHKEWRVKLGNRQHDEHFADESTQAGQTQPCEEDPKSECRVDGHLCKESAKFVEISVMDSVVNHADDKEHTGGTNTMSDHLEHGALNALVPRI